MRDLWLLNLTSCTYLRQSWSCTWLVNIPCVVPCIEKPGIILFTKDATYFARMPYAYKILIYNLRWWFAEIQKTWIKSQKFNRSPWNLTDFLFLLFSTMLGGKFHPRYLPVAFTGIYRFGKYSSSGKYWQIEFFCLEIPQTLKQVDLK